MKTSVALCTYNGQRFLREQLASFVAQTVLPDELVVCDDVSSDGTIEILREHAESAPYKVRIFENDANLGSNRNFAKAVSLCRGEIIFLSDQDDVWRADKVERIVGELDRHPSAGFAFTNAALVNQNLSPRSARLWDCVGFEAKRPRGTETLDLFPQLARHYLVTGATMAFRREYLPVILPIGEGWIHDGWIAINISALADVVAIDEDLILYRQHERQQIGAPRRASVLGVPIPQQIAAWGSVARQLVPSFWGTSDTGRTKEKGDDIRRHRDRYVGLLAGMARAAAESPSENPRLAANLELVSERVSYLSRRLEVREQRHFLKRWNAGWQHLRQGTYHRTGLGYLSFFRDVLEL